MKFDGVLWDMDGTLVDSEPLHVASMIFALKHEGIQPPEDIHEKVLGLSSTRVFEVFRSEYGLKASYVDWCILRYKNYLENAPHLKPRDGAMELFKLIRTRGLKQAIVSNSDRILVQANFSAIDLFEPDFISVSRNDVTEGKPSPESYRRAAHLLKIEHPKLLVIEDSPIGVQAGLSAGLTTVYWPQNLDSKPIDGAQNVRSAIEIEKLLCLQDGLEEFS